MALSKAQKKYIAIARAARRLRARLADIDWELEVLAPKVQELAQTERDNHVDITAPEEGDWDALADG